MRASIKTGVVLGAAVCALASVAQAQFGGRQFGATAGVVTPMGNLDKTAKTGFDVALRFESGGPSDPWSYRGTFSFTRFGGRDTVRNIQAFGYGGDIVHRSNEKFYQFLGFGLNQVKRVMSQTATDPYLGSETREERDFGLSGGVGVTFGSGRSVGFVEFGVTNLFGDQTDYAWFPVRVGVRF